MTEFFMLTLVAALMIMSPGPDFAIVVKNSLAFGRRSGMSASFGIAIATLCHVAINLLGVGVIIAQSIVAFTVMKVLGAAYLIYIGYKGIRTKPALKSAISETVVLETRKPNGFYSGFLTSLLNPKACLFFLSFFSVILSPNTKIYTQIFYGVWISVIAVIWFSLVSLFFTTPKISQKIQDFKHWLERFTGGVLILLGIKLLSSEITTSDCLTRILY